MIALRHLPTLLNVDVDVDFTSGKKMGGGGGIFNSRTLGLVELT